MNISDLKKLVDELKANDIVPIINLNIDISLSSAPPTPPPVKTKTFTVTRDPVANARFITGTNKSGIPIMEIYPSNDAPTSQRIQYHKGTEVKVALLSTIADGGGLYWEIKEAVVSRTLYLSDKDGSVV